MSLRRFLFCLAAPVVVLTSASRAQPGGFQASDLYRFRSVGSVQFSPDGKRLAYTVTNRERPGRPYSQTWIMELANGTSVRIGREEEESSNLEWSPDGQWIAYQGSNGGKSSLFVAHPDGSGARSLAPLEWTNGPLPFAGKRFAWSPDSKRIAFTSATAGPEAEEASGDPMVITRYLYKPDYAEGLTRFNDNRRVHIFSADPAGGQARQLTSGDFHEHSIDWSPNGKEIVFVSNRESNQDQFFNYDLFALDAATGAIRRITATENAEYRPRWSPDGKTLVYEGTRRGLTDLETTMEDTHVWLIAADGRNRRELGSTLDSRQVLAGWSPGGDAVYVTGQDRGSVKLYRFPAGGGNPEVIAGDPGVVSSWSVSQTNDVAYAFSGTGDFAQLYYKQGSAPAKKLTDLNAQILSGKQIAPVESFRFISNDNRYEVEAFLTEPAGLSGGSKHPLIVTIHGGPHGQQGPAFNFKNQVYAARGWATLMVNYRGSTGYGQAFADAVFGDQNGNEGQDVLYGVSAALRRYLWIDRNRLGIEGGSYGGQLTAWLITQTRMFKAAIPLAPIINLVSYNYTTYYNQYEQMEFGIFPHQGNLMDVLWERSALKYVANVATPVMLLHGENDNDVPIGETEQFYIALKDVGVEAVMVRYPREGHGLRETQHTVDSVERSIRWYIKHFPRDAHGPQP